MNNFNDTGVIEKSLFMTPVSSFYNIKPHILRLYTVGLAEMRFLIKNAFNVLLIKGIFF